MAGWSSDIDCYPQVSRFLKRLEQAGWLFEKRVGEYAHVICGCGEEHRARVILNPCLPDVLVNYISVVESTTCLE
ncbi:hypothetical protein A5725_24620 [Mycobacterium kubicae]|nr:hypothetical protein A5725_24620 [Mycobacterium kubicae]